MAGLIERGLTEDIIVQAAETRGMQLPNMELTLAELDLSLPYFPAIAEQLATQYGDRVKIFADRDADQLYDYFVIRYPNPDQESYLMPGSMDLWNSDGMQQADLVVDFLGQNGLGRNQVEDINRSYLLVDTGVKGSTTRRLSDKISLAYPKVMPMHVSGQIETKLLCAEKSRIESGGVTDFGIDTGNTRWPKYDRKFGAGHPYPSDVHSSTYGMMYGMQLAPKYRGAHTGLVRLDDGRVVTLPDPTDIPSDDVDGIQSSVNDSVVNPLAAAIVQYRVVQAALLAREAANTKL